MARVAGVEIPNNKRLEISLTYIYGIGRSISRSIIENLSFDINTKVKDLNEEQLNGIRQLIEKKYKVEGELRSSVKMDLKRLIDIGCYRGLRHRKGLPVRGQKTKTNARTRKSRRS